MSRTMTRTQIYIEPDVLAQAKLKAQTQGFNLSQYLRNLLKNDIINSNNVINIEAKKVIPIRVTKLKNRKITNYSGNHNIIYDYKL